MSQPIEFEVEVESASVHIGVEPSGAVAVEIDSYASLVEIDTPVRASVAKDEPVVIYAATPGIPGASGGGGGGSARMVRQPVSGALNGANTTFDTPANFVAGSTEVFLNGLMDINYTESGTHTIVFGTAPQPGDTIRIDFSIP